MKKLHTLLVGAFFLLLFAMHFTNSLDFSQDLGRHIKLGEIILQQHSIPETNLFSYTNPDFPFINHHWLTEVFFYIWVTILPFNSLIILKIILIIGAVGVLLYLGSRLRFFYSTFIAALLFSPLLMDRSTIRPELFGYLFFAGLLYIFFSYPKQKKSLFLIPIIMLLWINFHISFIFGFVVIGFLFLKVFFEYWQKRTDKKQASVLQKDLLIIASGFLITILNPHGIFGPLYPLNIFNNYGYTIVENQNIFFLNGLMLNPYIRYLFFLFPIVGIAFIILIWKKRFLEALLLGLFFAAEIMQIRHMPFFSLVAIPTVGLAIHLIIQRLKIPYQAIILGSIVLFVSCIGLSLIFFQNVLYDTFDLQKRFGMNVIEEYKKSSEYILKHNLPQNIFNNFDIGGYAIYRLYPQYSVFVDNRPEAYPKSFLQDVYIKMQTDPNLRKELFQKYNIHTIYFAHTDQTYWADAFLKDIAQDKSWKLVYLDSAAVVLVNDETAADIRNNTQYFDTYIKKETNYINLLKLSRALGIFGFTDTADKSFFRAADLNPSSCAINKGLYNQYLNSPYYQRAIEMKNKIWYCY